jgi:predicted glutamine amidotransferase
VRPIMCRMLAFVGDASSDLAGLFAAFRQGSEHDPYVKLALGNYTCHPHGWGYALYDGTNLHHFRSSAAVWEDKVELPRMKGKRVYAIFHSRLASDETLNTPICSHPFITSTNEEVLLLAHNGGVKVEDDSTGRVVDSEWALSQIAKAGCIDEALQRLRGLTKSALNLVLLRIPREGNQLPSIHCLNYYKSQQPEKIAYYRMYTADFAGGKIFLSSTFKDLNIQGLQNVQPAPFDQLFSLAEWAFSSARKVTL